MSKSSNWCFRVNNPSVAHVNALQKVSFHYLLYQKYEGERGRVDYLEGFIIFNDVCSWASVHKLLQGAQWWLCKSVKGRIQWLKNNKKKNIISGPFSFDTLPNMIDGTLTTDEMYEYGELRNMYWNKDNNCHVLNEKKIKSEGNNVIVIKKEIKDNNPAELLDEMVDVHDQLTGEKLENAYFKNVHFKGGESIFDTWSLSSDSDSDEYNAYTLEYSSSSSSGAADGSDAQLVGEKKYT